jgi:hypothetical protein
MTDDARERNVFGTSIRSLCGGNVDWFRLLENCLEGLTKKNWSVVFVIHVFDFYRHCKTHYQLSCSVQIKSGHKSAERLPIRTCHIVSVCVYMCVCVCVPQSVLSIRFTMYVLQRHR